MIEVDPKRTKRAEAFDLWINAPMPMVTVFKTLNISRLIKCCRKRKLKCNTLLCYCIGKAASNMEVFYLLPVGKKMMRYDNIAVNTIILNQEGEVSSCDIPFCDDLLQFNENYLRLTQQVYRTCQNHDLTEDMVIGTSALVQYDMDGIVNMYSGIFNNPFLHWGKYKRKGLKTLLSVSFQFHHTQMDGAHAGQFLNQLQNEINHLPLK